MVKLALSFPQNHPTGISQLQAFFRSAIPDDTGHGFGRQEFKDIHEEEEFLGLAIGFMMAAGAFRLEQYRQDMNLSRGKKSRHEGRLLNTNSDLPLGCERTRGVARQLPDRQELLGRFTELRLNIQVLLSFFRVWFFLALLANNIT